MSNTISSTNRQAATTSSSDASAATSPAVQVAASFNAIVDLQTNGTSSQYYNASTPGNSVTAQQAVYAQDLYTAVRDSPTLNASPNLRADALAIEKATVTGQGSVSDAINAFHADLDATLSGTKTDVNQQRLLSETEAAESTANSEYAQGSATGDDSLIVQSHNDEIDLANKLLADAPNTLTDAQTTALGNLQTSTAALSQATEAYAANPTNTQLRDAAGAAGEKTAADVVAARQSLASTASDDAGASTAGSGQSVSGPSSTSTNLTTDSGSIGVTTAKVQLSIAQSFLAGLGTSAALTSDQSSAVDMLRLYTQRLGALTQGYDQGTVTASQVNDVSSKFSAVLKAAQDAAAA